MAMIAHCQRCFEEGAIVMKVRGKCPHHDVPAPPPEEPTLLHEMNPPSPWQPEQDKIRLAALGKLLEELGECTAIVSRCIIQGIDEPEPVTGVLNRTQLEKEVADVAAGLKVVTDLFDLNRKGMLDRAERKERHLLAWRRLLT